VKRIYKLGVLEEELATVDRECAGFKILVGLLVVWKSVPKKRMDWNEMTDTQLTLKCFLKFLTPHRNDEFYS